MDISRIYFWNKKTRKYVELRCDHPNYSDGLPLFLHVEIRAKAADEAAAFNTEAERMAVRTRRINAIRNIDKTAHVEQVRDVTRLLEIPRIRQITGNIVNVHIQRPDAVTLGDFIAHDVASKTSVDDEILSPRKPIKDEVSNRKRRVPARDRRDAGQPINPASHEPSTPTPARRAQRNSRT
jgi:hypothetical protein